ncbi:hypothetical protein DERP_000241 [Dermatophagoides pteronyssinus]|uniref:Uncharacterized protein n=1 Tax=Dermatophagoides pteronyssinus TaxID=6956 RepID=A0ABQ8IZQ4_DERPT|nr:hypothetical protein DERP_000241 [Dermatophagoides pteronyssinus]
MFDNDFLSKYSPDRRKTLMINRLLMAGLGLLINDKRRKIVDALTPPLPLTLMPELLILVLFVLEEINDKSSDDVDIEE